MKSRINLISAAFALIVCCSYAKNTSPQTKEKARKYIDQQLSAYDQNFKEEQFDLCLENIVEILDLCSKFSARQNFIYNMTDKKHFILQKLLRFDDALKVAFELEEMSKKMGKTESAWNCLKIADSYLGKQNTEKSIQWMETAVYERDFENYAYLLQGQYQSLQSENNFQKMIKYMKDRIGLQHPAKDFTISLVDGGEYTLSSSRGKVVLIDFWDMYCSPCIESIPQLKAIYERFKDKEFEIIGISLDTEKEKLLEFIEKRNIPWKIACSYKGWNDDTVSLYNVNATPSTWLIDREGILQYYNLEEDELTFAVEKLMENR